MVYRFIASLLVVALGHLGACSTPPATPHHRETTTAQPASDTSSRRGDGYYLGRCAVCDGYLGATGEAVQAVYDGREVLFCTASCRASFDRDVAGSLGRLDAVMIADQRPIYPTTRSIVSGRELPATATECIWMNRLVRVGSPDELAVFLGDPEAYIRTLDAAVIEHQGPHYDITKCLVQGIELDEDTAVDVVVANRLMRVCCGECAARVRRTPRSRIPNVDFAWNRAMHHEPE